MSIGKVFIGNDNHGASWRAYQIEDDPVTVALICASPAALDATTAGKLATFLLSAAGPDAAREALVKLAPRDEEVELWMARAQAAAARASIAEKRLAAVLALVADWRGLATSNTAGESFKEGVAYCAKKLERELRATEGAEAPTGATT